MHEDAGGHESLSCHQDGSTADKSPAVSHTQPVTNTQDSFIRWCVFIRINLSPCNAFRRSVLAGRLFYLQIPNTEKWNIIQSPAFCFCVLWVCVWLCLCVSVCVCTSLSRFSSFFFTHGLGFISSNEVRWLTGDQENGSFPAPHSHGTHAEIHNILVFYVIAVTVI